MSFQVVTERLGPFQHDIECFVERKRHDTLAARGELVDILKREAGFAAACGTEDEGGGPAVEPAAKEVVQFFDAAGDRFTSKIAAVLRGDQSWKDADTAPADGIVMVAFAKLDATQLQNADAPTGGPVLGGKLFHFDYAMRKAQDVRVAAASAIDFIVEEQDGAVEGGKSLFKLQELAPITQSGFGKQAEFRERIEDEPRRFAFFDLREQHAGDLVQLDFGRMKNRRLRFRPETSLNGGQFEHRDLIQRPAMGPGDDFQFVLCFRKRNIKDVLAAPATFEEELQRQSGLS